ncbi:MAG: hypothetical protein PVSMB10_03780 [Pseudarthrobacter sp.]
MRTRDEFEVGPRSGKALREFAQALVSHSGLAIVEQGVTVGRAAAASGIGRVRIPDKQLGTIDNHGVATFSEDLSNVAPQPAPGKGRLPAPTYPLPASAKVRTPIRPKAGLTHDNH